MIFFPRKIVLRFNVKNILYGNGRGCCIKLKNIGRRIFGFVLSNTLKNRGKQIQNDRLYRILKCRESFLY